MRTALVILLLVFSPSSFAQDAVFLATQAGGRVKVTGRIVDYRGQALEIELLGGRRQSYPAARVVRIETQYTPQQDAGENAFTAGHWEEALVEFQKAIKVEPRRWVRRLLFARWVECYQALGQPGRAGEAFLLLLRDDPQTPYFECIPLAWLPRQPDPHTEQLAAQWMARAEPAAVLLGASYLLTSPQRAEALHRLQKLAAGTDKHIAPLARAQTWRAKLGTVEDAELAQWNRAIERLPPALRAGPYYVLGSARLQRRQYESAALALLRTPILYPQHSLLAAQALLDAARATEHFDPAAARRLYRELIQKYPQDRRTTAEAQQRLSEME